MYHGYILRLYRCCVCVVGILPKSYSTTYLTRLIYITERQRTCVKCPYCSNPDTSVVDSRETEDQAAIRRRRECEKCRKRFTTYERVELLDLVVIKKDGSRQPFDKRKVLRGIMRACEKRPIPAEKMERAVDDIERELRAMDTLEVPSRKIGDLVMKKLRELDPIAYIRFASVYKSFKNLEAFERELDKLKKE